MQDTENTIQTPAAPQSAAEGKRPWVPLTLERVRLREAESGGGIGTDAGIYSS